MGFEGLFVKEMVEEAKLLIIMEACLLTNNVLVDNGVGEGSAIFYHE